MADMNDIDTEGTDRLDSVAWLIHDEITDALHRNEKAAGKLHTSSMPASNLVLFEFTDGRTITVRLEISPKP